jgi:DHA1 family bicyclomycin/chloramphenicol resistance-like MFS transporter
MHSPEGGASARPEWRFVATLASITLIGPLAVHAFLPAMPAVKAVFGIPEAVAGLTFSLTLLVMAFATLIYGSLSDRHGRRPVLLTGLGVFVVGSALSALAPSIETFIAGRVLQAAGAGCSVTLARAIARDAYGNEGMVKVIAYLTMAYALGPMIAPFLGGLLVDGVGWRGVFWFATLAGAAIAWASWSVLYETHSREARGERKATGMVRDYVELFSRARFAGFVLQTGFSSGCFYTMAAASAFLMKDYLGRSATEFGMYFFLFPIGFFIGNLVSSRISQRFSVESMVLAGGVINFAAITMQSVAILAGYLTPLVLFLPGFLTTFGQGLALPNGTTGAMRVIPALSGTAAGVGVFCQTFIGAVFAQIYSMLADGTPIPMVQVVWTCSVLCLAMGVLPFHLRERS